METTFETLDGNEAVARIAYKLNEIIIIYPITPASPIGEWSDIYAADNQPNLWGDKPEVIEMQSEGGVAGAVHGSLQGGALTTTFTASQGLLLMLPDMYKIAGELTPAVFHVAARSIASQALSIFGDHSDVMAVRQSGFALLASSSVQEVHDFALIAQAASLRSRIPFVHFFDGFRTSHEIAKIALLDDETMKAMLDDTLIDAHRKRALSPDHPAIRGTSQNPDVFFQGRESVNAFYELTPQIVAEQFEHFSTLTGRTYRPFDYTGDPQAENIIIIMGSGAQTAMETVKHLQASQAKVGVVVVRLFRPFSPKYLFEVLPQSARSIAVLDRTKEPGSLGEPLYEDIVTGLNEAKFSGTWRADLPRVIGGRYGLSSKELTPAMIKTLFDELEKAQPKNHFTLGIYDDVTHTSLQWDPSYVLHNPDIYEAIFFGLGSDGTVGANKNSIKIIGEHTSSYAQGYFVYDSKKSGSMTVSHLRFGPQPIQKSYLIEEADFVACHQTVFMEKFDILKHAKQGAIFLLNSPFGSEETWQRMPRVIQEEIISKKLQFYTVNAYKVAKELGLDRRINTIMQSCFFAICDVIDHDTSLAYMEHFIEKSYAKRGAAVIQNNIRAIHKAREALQRFHYPQTAHSHIELMRPHLEEAGDFVQTVTAQLLAGEGDLIPVSQIPADGTWPTATTQFEKRMIAQEIPVWEPDLCTQCNNCVAICPHAVIRSKVYDQQILNSAPETFKSTHVHAKKFEATEQFTIQIAPQDCTGCALCTQVCPVHDESGQRAINMHDVHPIMEAEIANWDFFRSLPEVERTRLDPTKLKEAQLMQPLFEFSGACPGCGETPYIKLATQLFGERMLVANATGCSSIYGGNLPTTPWSTNAQGLGPAWSNSLFEDNAEFGLGFRLSVDKQTQRAKHLLTEHQGVSDSLKEALLSNNQNDEAAIAKQREHLQELKESLHNLDDTASRHLLDACDYLVRKSVWIIGGDGWAYDIGFGGLDHILSSGKNVNILVLDTQVYSNTGGQQSKATPLGATAKFAAKGKEHRPKDLAKIALSYEDVYVARVAMGANPTQTLKAMNEAESYEGVSIIIAYSHCIAHGYDLQFGARQQTLAVNSGLWPLFRYDPRKIAQGEQPYHLDSKAQTHPAEEYLKQERRFTAIHESNPQREADFVKQVQNFAQEQFSYYEALQKR